MTNHVINMAEQLAETRVTVGEHGARLVAVEKQSDTNAENFSRLQWWLISILVTGIGALALQVFQMATGKHG